MDYNILQQEEKHWIRKAIIKNDGKKRPKKTPTSQSWKTRINEEEFANWKEKQKRCNLFFDAASKNNSRKVRVGGIISDPDGK